MTCSMHAMLQGNCCSSQMSGGPLSRSQLFFSNLSKSQRKAGVEAGRPIPECLESDDEEPIYQDVNLKALQWLVENELQVDLDHPMMFLGHNLCRLGK